MKILQLFLAFNIFAAKLNINTGWMWLMTKIVCLLFIMFYPKASALKAFRWNDSRNVFHLHLQFITVNTFVCINSFGYFAPFVEKYVLKNYFNHMFWPLVAWQTQALNSQNANQQINKSMGLSAKPYLRCCNGIMHYIIHKNIHTQICLLLCKLFTFKISELFYFFNALWVTYNFNPAVLDPSRSSASFFLPLLLRGPCWKLPPCRLFSLPLSVSHM